MNKDSVGGSGNLVLFLDWHEPIPRLGRAGVTESIIKLAIAPEGELGVLPVS